MSLIWAYFLWCMEIQIYIRTASSLIQIITYIHISTHTHSVENNVFTYYGISCTPECRGDIWDLTIQPVVQTNGSSRSSTGRVLLSVSILSSVWFSTIWQRFNWWDSSCTLASFSAYFANFFCRSVMTVISLDTSKSICTVKTHISLIVSSNLNQGKWGCLDTLMQWKCTKNEEAKTIYSRHCHYIEASTPSELHNNIISYLF